MINDLLGACQGGTIVLDEIDGPLDIGNRRIVTRYLKNLSTVDGTQCIIISHNLDFYEKVDALLGIARDNERKCSACFSLDLTEYDDDDLHDG